MVALGDGTYLFSQPGKHEQHGQYTTVALYRATGKPDAPYAPVE